MPNEPLSTADLVTKLESYCGIESFAAQTDFGVVVYFTASSKAKEYANAAGQIRLRRPQNIGVRVSFVGAKIADMVSDGQQFRLAIYKPEDSRRFIRGSNLKDIERMAAAEIQNSKDPRLVEAGGLVNMRPQHITDAFLIKPPAESERPNVFREEVRQVEDELPGKKKRRVERSYYVLYVLERSENGRAELRRKFWFDRTQKDTPLVRQQIFENSVGRLGSDIYYSDWSEVNGKLVPGKVVIDRRNDGYRLELKPELDALAINENIPDTVFTLENTENLKEINLDEPRKASEGTDRKPKNLVVSHR
jgi:hypothetical protein